MIFPFMNDKGHANPALPVCDAGHCVSVNIFPHYIEETGSYFHTAESSMMSREGFFGMPASGEIEQLRRFV